ncbi:hypothetical protein CC78DRAFT_536444 [Lojkania enalia]|uniref:Fe2OG dioxygenase domain-containing protein n=1 Tax=Lojkania enalia TaxID=147567 RepID=A0A9P4MWM3_9PLEO|nr:hypothetical protein CC78DRAFT_536444 [Didymosphaeria enalia]
MATAAPVKPSSSDRFSISNLISHFWSKRRRRLAEIPRQYEDQRPPLIPSLLPLVLPEHQHTLSNLGWTTVTFPRSEGQTIVPSASAESENAAYGAHPLQSAYRELFEVAEKFFELPDAEKEKWKSRLGSEEGWSKIPGEKEFITLRTIGGTPEVLKAAAKRYWDLMGTYLSSCLSRIETSLSMHEDCLCKFVGPCKNLQEGAQDRTATMLRLFRYEGWDEKIVAEPHADLGLLSFVVGNVPGLEVWDGGGFVPIEKEYVHPAGTLLAGRQLERYTNFRYSAGGHRVVSYGKPPTESGVLDKHYRFSIVFVLRAHEDVVVDSEELETEVTGNWREPVRGVKAGTLYEEVRRMHFNINTGIKEREGQRRRLEARNKGSG